MFDYVLMKKAVEDSGFKQTYISKQIGISPKRLSFILNGKAKPPIEIYVKICKFLGVAFETFIVCSEQKKSAS